MGDVIDINKNKIVKFYSNMNGVEILSFDGKEVESGELGTFLYERNEEDEEPGTTLVMYINHPEHKCGFFYHFHTSSDLHAFIDDLMGICEAMEESEHKITLTVGRKKDEET